MKPEELKKEKNHIQTVVNKLRDAKKDIENRMEMLGKENMGRLKELREDGSGSYGSHSTDFDILMEQLHQKNLAFNLKQKYQTLEEYEFLISEPYFSRIDLFNPKDKKLEDFYIGKFSFTEKKPVVTDWRSRVASVYYRYRYPQKNVSYETPLGKEIRDLKLKRTYEIQDGSLIRYYNNDLQLDESTIISKKIEKRTGGVLEDIVQTIQESQLDIIEADPRQVCIVQGCVGSGKSTVAIHKLAHIFFNFPKLIRPERCLMVTKSQILAGYLSTLFPKLGIFDVTYKTIRDIAYNFVYIEQLKIKVDLGEGQDTGKYNIKEIEKIRNLIKNIQKSYEDKINKIFKDPDLETFASFKYSYDQTPYENISDILNDIVEELVYQKNNLKKNPDSPRAWLYKENITALRKILMKSNKIKNEIGKQAFEKIVKDLGLNLSEKLNYVETLLYIFVYSEIVGIRNFRKYDYCIVDEAQDFSLLEYLFLDKTVQRGRFALFGDLNQSLEKDGIKKWEEVPEVIKDAKSAVNFKLTKNYRSTKQIINFANKILKPYTSKYLPKSIDRVGVNPVDRTFENKVRMLESFKEDIELDVKDINKSIGVICFDNSLEEVEDTLLNLKALKDKRESLIKLESSQKTTYIPKGIYLMDSKDCKGLEFAKVYVINLNLKKIKTFDRAREAFVSVTRAMNELVVYGVK